VPGAHGGTATALDDAANELIDPSFDRPLRPVAPVAQLDLEDELADEEEPEVPVTPTRKRRRRPPVPAWEDVLLDVRSGGRQ
jgi:hypothetical protein